MGGEVVGMENVWVIKKGLKGGEGSREKKMYVVGMLRESGLKL